MSKKGIEVGILYMYSFYTDIFPDVSLSNMLGRDVSHHHCISLQIWPLSSG